MVDGLSFDDAAALLQVIGVGPNAVVSINGVIGEVNPGLCAYRVRKDDIVVSLKEVVHELYGIGVDDRVNVVDGEVEIAVSLEELLDLVLRSAGAC